MEQRKSRGSFVDGRTKSITYTNIFVDSVESNIQKSKLSVKEYLELLKTEKEEWKEILRKKKMQCQEYERQYKNQPITITRTSVEDFLPQEDKDFLESKPNYLKMVESVKHYIDSLNYLNKYKLDIIDYYRKAFDELEFQKKKLADEMCASDLCDICNIRNCGFPDHSFDQDF